MNQKKFCINCGTPAATDAVFCVNCGTRFPPPEYMSAPAPTYTPESNAAASAASAAAPVQEVVPDLVPMQTPAPAQAPAPAYDPEATVAAVSVTPPMQTPAPAQAPASAYDPEATVAAVSVTPPMQAPAPAQAPEPAVRQISVFESAVISAPKTRSTTEQSSNGKVKNKKKSIVGRVIATVISVLLAVIMTVAVIATAAVGSLGKSVSYESITKTVSEMDVYGVVKEIVLPDYSYEGKEGLAAYVYQLIDENGGSMDEQRYAEFEEKLNAVLDGDSEAAKAVEAFVGEKLGAVVSDAINGTSEANIKAEDIKKLLEEVKPDIESAFGVKINEEDFETIDEFFEKNNVESISVDNLRKGNEAVFGIIETVLSDTTLYIMIAVCAVLLLTVIFVHGRYFRVGFIIAGIALLISGAAVYMPSVMLDDMVRRFVVTNELLDDPVLRAVLKDYSAYTGNLTESLGLAGIIILASAAAFIVAGIIISVAVGKKKKRGQQR